MIYEAKSIPIGWNEAAPLQAITRTDSLPRPFPEGQSFTSTLTIRDTNGAPLIQLGMDTARMGELFLWQSPGLTLIETPLGEL